MRCSQLHPTSLIAKHTNRYDEIRWKILSTDPLCVSSLQRKSVRYVELRCFFMVHLNDHLAKRRKDRWNYINYCSHDIAAITDVYPISMWCTWYLFLYIHVYWALTWHHYMYLQMLSEGTILVKKEDTILSFLFAINDFKCILLIRWHHRRNLEMYQALQRVKLYVLIFFNFHVYYSLYPGWWFSPKRFTTACPG